ncbi:2OG-Fe(II) oxygenase family protein [Candidatus Pelagibacter sp.]|nr:2OG-Fe(II) oxygenase family protein [Candidatus Pelagibacter sp.]
MKVVSPFGPKIGIIKIPKKIINQINQEFEKIIKNKNLSKKNDYSKKLVGQVKQEIELSKSFINKYLKKFINENINKFLKKTLNKKSNKIKIKNLWVVKQLKNDYNPIHFHNGDLSGVGYLKIPQNLTKGNKKLKTNGTIDFIHGSKSFLSNSIYNHIPKVGDLILFPNYLMHTAYPFKKDGERRSFSFNLEVDKKVSNIFND